MNLIEPPISKPFKTDNSSGREFLELESDGPLVFQPAGVI
jgi:hypothetical protein